MAQDARARRVTPFRTNDRRMKPKHQRLLFVVGSIVAMAIAATLILKVFNDNLMYFYTPSMLDSKRAAPGFNAARGFRLGGLVKPGSVATKNDRVHFTVSDGSAEYDVTYQGLLPTLFREGQGVVLVGHLVEDRLIRADTILAKHDENYMPPEVADALKRSGHWEGKDGSYGRTP